MRATIIDRLEKIEKEHAITILYACESGSRGWEFPSPDSDYDVRFIYIRPVNAYLSIQPATEHLSFPINDELDIYGWDLRKVLQLMMKSNTTPFEWLQSPIVYMEKAGFQKELWSLCLDYFSARIHAHHYMGIAHGAWQTLENGHEIKIKKLFYVLRPLLSAKWCIEKSSIASMTIGPLLTLLPDELALEIRQLIELKAGLAEAYPVRISPSLKTFIEEETLKCHSAIPNLNRDIFSKKSLDDFFIKTVKS